MSYRRSITAACTALRLCIGSPFQTRILGVTLLLASVVAPTTQSSAQTYLLDEPTSSPIWWTLSEAVTPEQLKHRHTNVDQHREAYSRALAQEGSSLPLEARGSAEMITRFLDPTTEPEMMPLWFAFHILSMHLAFTPDRTLRKLEMANLSEEGRRTVLDNLRRFHNLVSERRAATAADVTEFVDLLREALSRAPDRAARAAVYDETESGNLSAVADAATARGLDGSRIQQLYAAWRLQPDIETARVLLPQLRSQLTDEDWWRLRSFLLIEVTPTIGTIMEVLPYD